VVITAGGINKHLGVGLAAAVTLRQHLMQWLPGDLGHGVPDRHVDGAHRHGPFPMTARLFIAHHAVPDLERIQVVAARVAQTGRVSLQHTRPKALADQAALSIAAIRVEAITDHRPAIAHNVGDHRHQAERHLREIDEGVTDVRADGSCGLDDVDDSHG